VKSYCSWDLFLWKISGGLHTFMSFSKIFQLSTCCRPPGPGSTHILGMQIFLLKLNLFSCFAVDFILGGFLSSWRTRNISCIALYCQHARPSGLAKYYHQSELPVLITSQLKIKLIPEIKGTAIWRQTSAESSLFETCVVGRDVIKHSNYF